MQMAETTGPRSRSSLPSLTMAYFIISKSLAHLENGLDVFHLDSDAFLLKDPVPLAMEQYPEADIVASPDCTHAPHGLVPCDYYINDAFKRVHADGKDPLRG